MNVVPIRFDLVEVGDRLRPVDEDYAQLIAASMAADGQRTPIEVRAAGTNGRYPLIAGAHRHRAAEIAGLAELQAVVLDVGELNAKRLQIEENLCRHELNELDRSAFVAEWKAVYQAIEAAPKHGGRRRGSSAQNEHLIDAPRMSRFSAIAADRLLLSEQTIRRLDKRYRAIAPDVRADIAGTWLADHGAELDFLARLKPDVQRKVIAMMRARGATSIKPLRDQVMGIRAPVLDPDVVQFEALMKLWRKTSAKARRRFEAELAKDHQFDIDGQPTTKARENGDA
jgi:ParB family chromosome partitioning protein